MLSVDPNACEPRGFWKIQTSLKCTKKGKAQTRSNPDKTEHSGRTVKISANRNFCYFEKDREDLLLVEPNLFEVYQY